MVARLRPSVAISAQASVARRTPLVAAEASLGPGPWSPLAPVPIRHPCSSFALA